MSRFNFLCKIITVKMSNIFTYATYISHSFCPQFNKNFSWELLSFLKFVFWQFHVYLYMNTYICVVYKHNTHVWCILITITSPLYLLPSLLSLLPTSLFPTFMSCFVLWCNEFNQGHLSVLGFAISLWSTSRCRDTRKGSLEWRSSW